MSLRHGLLGLINDKPRTGYELGKIFHRPIQHFWTVKMSQIYKELTDLEKKGMLSSEVIVQTSSPNKKVYHITEAGREELFRWLRDTNALPVIETKDAFMLKFFFADELGPEECIKMLHLFKERCEDMLADMKVLHAKIEQKEKEMDNSIHFTPKLVRQIGRQILELKIEWAENSLKQLEKIND